MNLSDLVHCTAGENNKLLKPSSSENVKTTSNNSQGTPLNNNLFQNTMLDPTAPPSNLFSSFSRQDEQLLFSIPNTTDWINNTIFFNNNSTIMNNNDNLIETVNTNQYIKQDFSENILKLEKESGSSSSNHSNHNSPVTSFKLKVTGDTVTKDNIEEGYIQFISEHDPNYVTDGLESITNAKRKFRATPKTGDLQYTPWDVFELVKMLHNKEIKNWSQLVGRLGLKGLIGRPQFAQRVKRWMHRYKIDCYFDYLLGNEYQFNGSYSNCLTIGNYKKRTNKKSDDEGELVDEDTDNESRLPILLAGSRKRMRDTSTEQNNILIENAQKYLKRNNNEEEEEDEEEEEEEEEEEGAVEEEEEEEEGGEEIKEDVYEEDELASTSSSPISPKRIIIPSPPIAKHTHHSPIISNISPPINSNSSNNGSNHNSSIVNECTNCLTNKTNHEKEITRLEKYIKELETKINKQNNQINKLVKIRDRTERWRKQIISDLARGPIIASDDDDDDDEEEEDEEDEEDD